MSPLFHQGKTVMAAIVLLCTFSLSGCSGPQGNAEQGARWYAMHNCSSCHGTNGNDGRAAKIASLRMGFGAFENYLRDPDSPSMPTFSETKLPKSDAADIYAWLRSLPE